MFFVLFWVVGCLFVVLGVFLGGFCVYCCLLWGVGFLVVWLVGEWFFLWWVGLIVLLYYLSKCQVCFFGIRLLEGCL